jgi:phenylpropionate dioxygenase-like ring-hydroxylating dioxygenase large terminal subunit
LRAFHNVCQHRGSAVLLEKQGTARRFICPYHAWGYALDGSLTSVPEAHNFACLDKPNQGLAPVRCETMRGMIFVNRDMNAIPLAEFMAATEAQLGDFPLEDMVVKNVVAVEMECNWKTALDNFLEIYHVNTVHAKSIAPYLDSKSFSISLYKHGHARFATRKRGETIFESDKEAPDDAPALFKEHTVALPMFPNSFMAIDPIGFAWQSWWPLGPRRSVMVLHLMGWKDDSEADKKFWEGMTEQVTAIAGEDLVLFAEMQRNLESGVLPGIMMGYQERALYWYQEEIDRTMGIEHIPEHLRVTQVLSGHTAD